MIEVPFTIQCASLHACFCMEIKISVLLEVQNCLEMLLLIDELLHMIFILEKKIPRKENAPQHLLAFKIAFDTWVMYLGYVWIVFM